MDSDLNEAQGALQKMAREFALDVMRPRSLELDREQDPGKCFAWDVIEEGSRLGLRTLVVSEKYGGGGVDLLTMGVVGEELGYGDLGMASSFNQCWCFSRILELLTTEDQRERFLRPFMEDHRFLLAQAMTEPDAGTDNLLPYDAPDGGYTMTAVPDGNHFVLNGTKMFITNGGAASLYFVNTRTDRQVGISKGTTLFLVSADSPGLDVARYIDKPGRRCVLTAELYFRDVRVPRENILGDVNQPPRGWVSLAGKHFFGVMAVGTARAAFEMALEHTRERIQGGKPIKEHQAVKLMLGEMWMLLETARTVSQRGAWMVDRRDDPKISPWVKDVCVEYSFKVCQMAMDLFGGYAFTRENPVEKFYRDVMSYRHPFPSNIIRMRIADQL